MRKMFGLKKRESQASEDSGPASSGRTIKNTTESRAKDAIASTEPHVKLIPRANQGLGVRVLYEPPEPAAAVVE